MATQTLGVTFQYSHTIGQHEIAGNGFIRPVAMVRGQGDLIYVVNRNYEAVALGKRVTICTVGEDYIGQFGLGVAVGRTQDPYADGSLVWPTSIALDKDGNVYLADEWLNRISIFSKDGEWLGKWGTPGDGDGEIDRPAGIAFDKDDNLFLVDSVNNRIQVFAKDGKLLARWGRAGSDDGELNMPWGIDIDTDGDVYVADWRNDRIQKFSPEGEFLMKFGTPAMGDGDFNQRGTAFLDTMRLDGADIPDGVLTRPTGVAVDKDGIVYVADWGNERLQVFDADGSFVTKITGDATMSKWGKEKLDADQEMWREREVAQGLEREKLFCGPIAVEVDDESRIFVLETVRSRIQIYRKIVPYFTGIRL